MDNYIKKLRSYISEHQIEFDESVVSPCLDSLWWHYGEFHSLENEKTKQGFRDIFNAQSDLHPKRADDIITSVGALCAEHERLAFIAGIQLGAQLMLELNGTNTQLEQA